MKLKLKTKKSAWKRFRFTATGKVKVKKAGLRHQLSHRRRSDKVKLRKAGYIFKGFVSSVQQYMPYGSK